MPDEALIEKEGNEVASDPDDAPVDAATDIEVGPVVNEWDPFRWRYTPHLLIFLSSACIMIVEVVAGRLIARHLGSSLYTWTSIIGVVLAGMSLGNYLGGRMADRWNGRSFLGWLFLFAGAACLVSLVLNHGMANHSFLKGFHWPTRILLSVTVIFVVPALVLGTISPVTAKLALERSDKVGATIGSVYAWGAVGSIVGTLACGFWMIAALGSKGVVLIIAFCLSMIGLWLGPRRGYQAIWVMVVIAIMALAWGPGEKARKHGEKFGLRDRTDYAYSADSHYQFVKVYEKNSEHDKSRRLRVLSLDYLIHGYVDLDDPLHLEYDYERVYRDIAQRFARDKVKVSAFFIGGGSYTFPRWVLHEWPGSTVHVSEIDPLVVEANHRALGLSRDTPIVTFEMDARNAVDDLPDNAKYDLIFGDAFNDLSVPWHLTTLEFNQKLAMHLAPDGAYLVNIIDDFESGLFLGAYAETLKKSFKNVYVFCTEKGGVQEGRDTFVVAASNASIDVSDCVADALSDFPGALLNRNERAELTRKCGGRILTDDDAPVENLLEPVVRKRKRDD